MPRYEVICPIVSMVNFMKRKKVIRKTVRATQLSGNKSLFTAPFCCIDLRNAIK